VHSHISKALEDCAISDDEYKLILDEVDKYRAMKEEIRKKMAAGSSVLDEETKNELIKRGREQARASFIKKLASAMPHQSELFVCCRGFAFPFKPTGLQGPCAIRSAALLLIQFGRATVGAEKKGAKERRFFGFRFLRILPELFLFFHPNVLHNWGNPREK
jgi:hypothetical protein